MLIDKINQMRIQSDAAIAIDALSALKNSPTLDSNYIKEKADKAQRCLDFIKYFSEK